MFPLQVVCAKAVATGQKKAKAKGKKTQSTPSPNPKVPKNLTSAIKNRYTKPRAGEPVRKKLDADLVAASSNPDQRVELKLVGEEPANPSQHDGEVAPSGSASCSSNPAQDVAGEMACGSALVVDEGEGVEDEAAASGQDAAKKKAKGKNGKDKKGKERPHFCGR